MYLVITVTSCADVGVSIAGIGGDVIHLKVSDFMFNRRAVCFVHTE